MLESGDHLPETGLVHALPCIGEKDYELEAGGRIGEVVSVQVIPRPHDDIDTCLKYLGGTPSKSRKSAS